MLKRVEKPSVYRLAYDYAFPLWKWFVLLVVLSVTSTFLIAIQPLFISGLLEVVAGDVESTLSQRNSSQDPDLSFFNLNTIGNTVTYYLFGESQNLDRSKLQISLEILQLFLVTSLLSSFFSYAAAITSSWIRTSSSRLVRRKLSRHILSLDMDFFNNQKAGELTSRFNQDVTNIAIGLGPLLHGFIQHGLLIILYSSYLFSTDITLVIGILVIGVFHWGVTKVVKKPVRLLEKKYLDKLANLVGSFQEMLANVRAVKSFNVEGFFCRKTDDNIDSLKNAEFDASKVRQLDPNLRLFVDSVAISLIFILGVVQIENGNLTLQGFILFLLVGKLLINPINKFSVNFVWMQALLASYDKIFEIYQVRQSIESGNKKVCGLDSGIEFRDVSFSYDQHRILDRISFRLNKGEIVAIVGPSGAGKSTLLDLILRLQDPSSGAILVDGVDLNKVNVGDYRELFGVVFQENFLINDTIKNNICFGFEKCEQVDVIRAAKVANAHNFITSLPDKYDTIVGDRGVKLSGGQRQRVSIARSIYRNPEIIVFDEATSSLDSESEDKVHSAIESILSSSTAVIVAHRLSTIMQADKIIVLNRGKIEDIGAHAELLGRSETYEKLYKLQFKEGAL